MWRCRLVAHYSHDTGDMWPVSNVADDDLSPDYLQHRKGKRAPLILNTPGGPWLMDGRLPDGTGWTITGDPPNLTAQPSINVIGTYHGFLTDGVLSDDLEGRTYDG